jgi:hypothetical protein
MERGAVVPREAHTDWEILMTAEVESFLDELCESDRDSH